MTFPEHPEFMTKQKNKAGGCDRNGKRYLQMMESVALFDGKHIGLGAKSRPFASQETAVYKTKNNYLRGIQSKNNCTLFTTYKHYAGVQHVTFAHDSGRISARRFLNSKKTHSIALTKISMKGKTHVYTPKCQKCEKELDGVSSSTRQGRRHTYFIISTADILHILQ